jgi:hypothetical protein
MNLKDQGIYRLPNGRELVARRIAEQQTILYNLSAADPAAYELNPDGRLLFNGRLTAWAINDLRDTGRVALAQSPPAY